MMKGTAATLSEAVLEFLEGVSYEMEKWPDDTFIPSLEYINELVVELESIKREHK